jgi:Mannosylglycerate hydrolase MGH1-like glycoside hydrolase domain/Glycosyl hydrolase family 65, C-terminal domain
MQPLLRADDFKHYVDHFNATDNEDVVNLVPNAQSWAWMSSNVPLFSCPDRPMEEMYYYRWWTFRKHIKQTPAGMILTEFITPVRHAGSHNSISCALGHHLAEGRWLRDQKLLDEYTRFWFRGADGKPEPKFHKYSQWVAAAMWDRYMVSVDKSLLLDLLDDLVADYQLWEAEKLLPSGLFWQFDVWDGMEESISGSRTHRNARPTINSYMYANANAIAEIASMAGRAELVGKFHDKAFALKKQVLEALWDPRAKFFKAQTQENGLSDAREAIGFIPWCFNLPTPGYEDAWAQLVDPQGFWAPFGLTTAERRHPKFRSHGVGKCEWDGAVWPFATSQTLGALANVLRHYQQPHVTKRHYLEAMQTYVKSQHRGGEPYIGEYLDETTGEWLKGDNARSRYYNHSTFCDLVISGLVGLVPRSDQSVEVDPLLPDGAWDWFCLDGVPYHGKSLSILWDKSGTKFGQGAGLSLLVNGNPVAQSAGLTPVRTKLPQW